MVMYLLSSANGERVRRVLYPARRLADICDTLLFFAVRHCWVRRAVSSAVDDIPRTMNGFRLFLRSVCSPSINHLVELSVSSTILHFAIHIYICWIYLLRVRISQNWQHGHSFIIKWFSKDVAFCRFVWPVRCNLRPRTIVWSSRSRTNRMRTDTGRAISEDPPNRTYWIARTLRVALGTRRARKWTRKHGKSPAEWHARGPWLSPTHV